MAPSCSLKWVCSSSSTKCQSSSRFGPSMKPSRDTDIITMIFLMASRRPADPALPPEVPELGGGGRHDERPREAVALRPVQLGDVAEVLAVETDDEGGEQEKGGHDGQDLHDLVLVVGHL